MRSFRKYLLVTTGIILILSCTENNKRKKIEAANGFLHYYSGEFNKNKAPMVLDSYSQTDAKRCLLGIEDELTGLGFNMKDLIEDSLFKKSLRDSTKFISKEKLPGLSVPNSWQNFKSQYKNGFYIISVPIVNDKCDSIIFYYSYFCDERCGNGEMVLYKKTNSGWKLVKKFCNWVS